PTDGLFRVTQTKVSSTDTVVSYTVGGTATAGSDYTTLSGTVTIPAGLSTAEGLGPELNGGLSEGTKTVTGTLSTIRTGDPDISIDSGNANASLDITDDDTATVSVAKVNDGAETDTPSNGKFRVTQTNVSSTDTVIAYTVGGTATPGSDYTALSGTVTIPAGLTSADIDVAVLNDNIVEGTETVAVTLPS